MSEMSKSGDTCGTDLNRDHIAFPTRYELMVSQPGAGERVERPIVPLTYHTKD